VVKLELGPESLARERQERVEVAALERLVALPQEVDVRGDGLPEGNGRAASPAVGSIR
jgi:hypothetical protein